MTLNNHNNQINQINQNELSNRLNFRHYKMNRLTVRRIFVVASYFSGLGIFFSVIPALADGRCHVHWDKLGLSATQSQQIQSIEEGWQKQYAETAPAIADEQQRLSKKLGEHCDQLEIISLHNSIDRKQMQLRQMAMMTFLKKRSVLNDSQQRSLEVMMNAEIAKRQAEVNPGVGQSEVPNGMQDLLQRVHNAFPTAPDR